MTLTVVGALNHTIAEALFGRRLDLPLHLRSGHIMFVKIPRSLETHEYVGADGARRSIADLTETPVPGYARARVEANLALAPPLLDQICARHIARGNDAVTIVVDQHKLNLRSDTPYRTLALRCDARGLTPVAVPR